MNLLAAYTFSDLFKSKFLENWASSQLSVLDMIISLIASFAIGLVIFAVYKMSYRGVVYSHSFNVSLVLMCVITTAIIVTISSNVILSLGMVGALSIVRFRSAIKDPVDIIFLFWSLCAGIIVGAQNYPFAIISTAAIGAVCLIMFKLKGKKEVFLLVVVYNTGITKYILDQLHGMTYTVKSKNVSKTRTELTVEITLKNKNNTSFVDRISSMDGVESAVLVSYNGDFVE